MDEILDADSPIHGNDRVRIGLSPIPRAGKGLFLTDDSPAFTEVSRAKPVVMTVAEGLQDKICDWCYVKTDDEYDLQHYLPDKDKKSIKRCASCKEVGYCSKECQQKAWHAYHKVECKMFRSTIYRQRPRDHPMDRHMSATYRLLCMQKMGTFSDEQLRRVMKLPHNEDELFKTELVKKGLATHDKPHFRARVSNITAATGCTLTYDQVYELAIIVSLIGPIIRMKHH